MLITKNWIIILFDFQNEELVAFEHGAPEEEVEDEANEETPDNCAP